MSGMLYNLKKTWGSHRFQDGLLQWKENLNVIKMIAFCNSNIIYLGHVNRKKRNSPRIFSTTLHSSPVVLSFTDSLLNLPLARSG